MVNQVNLSPPSAAYSAPSHYLNQCWVIVNRTLRKKVQWNFNQNTKLFIHENASENIVCEMAAVLFRGSRVKHDYLILGNEQMSLITFSIAPMIPYQLGYEWCMGFTCSE